MPQKYPSKSTQAQKEYYERNKNRPEYKRSRTNSALKYQYGITLAEFDAMLLSQNNRCAICQDTGKLCVDHCHNTGKVRGLLCYKCNTVLGQARDSTEILTKAIAYLQQ